MTTFAAVARARISTPPPLHTSFRQFLCTFSTTKSTEHRVLVSPLMRSAWPQSSHRSSVLGEVTGVSMVCQVERICDTDKVGHNLDDGGAK
jgi:hypothetical protein